MRMFGLRHKGAVTAGVPVIDPGPGPSTGIGVKRDAIRDEVWLEINNKWYRTKNWTRAGYANNGDVPIITPDITYSVSYSAVVSGTHTAEVLAKTALAKAYTDANPGKWAMVYFPYANGNSYIVEGRVEVVNAEKIIFAGDPTFSSTINWIGAVSVNGNDYPWTGRFTIRAGNLESQGAENRADFATGVTYAPGTTTVTLSSNADILNNTFVNGKYALLRQANYPAKYDGKFWYSGNNPGTAFVERLVKITGSNSTTKEITFDVPLYYEMDTNRQCRVETRPNITKNIGFQNLIFQHGSTNAVQADICFMNAEDCWVDNVKHEGPYSFAVNAHWCRRITWQDGEFNNPINIGGGYNGYSGWFGGSSECLQRRVINKNIRHGPNIQSNSAGNVIADCENYNCDWHDHNQATMGNCVTKIKSFRGNSGTPFHFDMPTANNKIHAPSGFYNFYYNIDGGPTSKWNRIFRAGAFLEECVFCYLKLATSGRENNERNNQPALRIPLISTWGGVGGPLHFESTTWGWDAAAMITLHSISPAQAQVYTDRQAFFDLGPGITLTSGGRVEQTGLYSYPGYSGEPGGETYYAETPSDYDVRFRNTKVYGVAASKLFYGHAGRGPTLNENFFSDEVYPVGGIQMQTFPGGIDDIYEYVMQFKRDNPSYWATGEVIPPGGPV